MGPMDTNPARKSYEIQKQIRNNAEEFKMTLSDLYSWQKNIKDKEKRLQADEVEEEVAADNLPVRTHILEEQEAEAAADLSGSSTGESVGDAEADVKENMLEQEKIEVPVDPNEEKRKRANECKDAGNRSVKVKKYDRAIEHYTSAIEIYPEDAVYYTNRALCHLKLEDFASCIKDCSQALALDPKSVKAYYRRMQANESLGNIPDAIRDCHAVLKLEPKSSEASLQRLNERLQREAKNAPKKPRFSPSAYDMVDIKPVLKKPHQRSNKPLIRVPVTDIISSSANREPANLKISDDDIDKLFNSNCGPFVEVKKPNSKDVSTPREQPNTARATTNKKKEIPKTTASKEDNVKPQVQEAVKELPLDERPSTSKAAAKAIAATDAPKNEKEQLPLYKRPVPPAPTSSSQFYTNWKELNPEQKFHYLKSIKPTLLRKILGASLDTPTLTDVLFTIRDYYLPREEPSTAETMLQVSLDDQIRILSMFLSRDARYAITEILASIKDNQAKATIAKNFEINI